MPVVAALRESRLRLLLFEIRSFLTLLPNPLYVLIVRFHLLNIVSAFLCLLCYDVHDVRDTIFKAYDAYDWLRPCCVWTFVFDIHLMVSRPELITTLQPYLSETDRAHVAEDAPWA